MTTANLPVYGDHERAYAAYFVQIVLHQGFST
jgi:hypothetical protein